MTTSAAPDSHDEQRLLDVGSGADGLDGQAVVVGVTAGDVRVTDDRQAVADAERSVGHRSCVRGVEHGDDRGHPA